MAFADCNQDCIVELVDRIARCLQQGHWFACACRASSVATADTVNSSFVHWAVAMDSELPDCKFVRHCSKNVFQVVAAVDTVERVCSLLGRC